MDLNHINLCASDVAAMTEVLETHFEYRTVASGQLPDYLGATNAGDDFSMLVGTDRSYIVISQIPAPEEGGSAYPPYFHFGVMQDSREAVLSKHAELAAAGFHPGSISDGFEVAGATWTAFYCEIGDGLQVEVNHRTSSALFDGAPEDRADRDERQPV